ncbi:uncharacterized protein A1O5_05749 [Cladophialophora psammophila CBS 110553]|uniref:Carboxylic ester hydrolase n=1 Tax=Cladophialophora psammophila CBS 110553 TaxID=1182543 RepID=W9XK60_9EURO|nr:uncharacterized protein A1O5_05749 [Cladophialophora psammophila CBS 110553]EXJ70759.1 hypothetical protein A1O5_05749 [Cladophialophora psammophila CBS 110553]
MALLSPTQACTPSTFSSVSLFGAEVISVDASIVTNYSFPIPEGWRYSQPSVNVENATFCNVTATYTHPDQNDTIYAEVWLPPNGWNGRLQSIGGGGWAAGRFVLSYAGMAGAIYDGYATATTDAGLGTSLTPATWLLNSPGNLNFVALDDFGQTSLGDLAVIAKQVIEGYYGQAPLYSYWNGCSNGGRQASILAQQYPEAYDGIIAAAPGMYWAELSITSVWPAFYMDLTQQYPLACELTQLTTLAIAECDGLDGVNDGLIADPEKCRATFKPADYVGTTFTCAETGLNMPISAAAIDVSENIWNGPRYSNGDFMWYGFEVGTNLSELAATTCTQNSTCIPANRASLDFWQQYFVLRDPSANVTTLTHPQFDDLYRTLKKELAPIAATETRIADFQEAGGKMITYHGLADAAISPKSTLHYYQEVSTVLDNVMDFYLYYRVPGLQHCWGGSGGQPIHLFDQLRSWVENGTAPDASPVTVQLPQNATMDEVLCPYPQEAFYEKSCANGTSSLLCWSCK